MLSDKQGIEEIAINGIGERYSAYRIVNPRADAVIMKSIQKYGQISPVVCVRVKDSYELIDGFKRLKGNAGDEEAHITGKDDGDQRKGF